MSQETEPKPIPPVTPKKLSRKQEAFIENYLLHFNAAKAYSTVYGILDPAHASGSASRLLADATMQQYLQRRLAERKAELHIDVNYVVRKLTEIVEADFVDSTQYLTANQLKEIPSEIRKLIQSIEIHKTKNSQHTNSGDYETETEKYKVTFMSKDAALQGLGKHTGTYIKDNVSGQFNLDQMTFTDALKQLDI